MTEQTELELISQSEPDTEAIGRAIGLACKAGDLIGLVGELGAGKTLLVKGIALGLEVTESNEVKSPSFVIIREHEGRLRLFHIDAYRLNGPTELWSLGLEEILSQAEMVVIEWVERVADSLPIDRLTVRIDITGPSRRRLRLRAGGTQANELLGQIRGHLDEGFFTTKLDNSK